MRPLYRESGFLRGMGKTTILITGASGGIGAALAEAYAAPSVHLVLWGRDTARLEATAIACRRRGAHVEVMRLDVRDIPAMSAALDALDERLPLDIAVLNAGLGGVATKERLNEHPERVFDIAMVNFAAPTVGATVLAERMAARRRGQIVLMGSISESFPLPMAPTYAGSKAGLALFAEALYLRLQRHGVSVTLVSPGFIDTAMSRELGAPRPFLMTSEAAAAIMVRKLARRPFKIVLPWQFMVLRGLSRILPRVLTRAVLNRY